MSDDAIVQLKDITKFYGEKLVFRNLDFIGQRGRLYVVSGANGSGKSTLLRLLAGLSKPASGIATWASGARVAYLAHATFLYEALTAIQNLRFWSVGAKLDYTDNELMNLLEKMELSAYAHEKTRVFSRGMAQRLNFARCLLLRPDLLLLDEPYTGLDERSQNLMKEEMIRLKQGGACIVQVSHSPQTDSLIADQQYYLADRRLRREDVAPC